MAVDGRERRHAVHEMDALHHHPGDPEEDDVKPGDQHRAGVIALECVTLLRPPECPERPEGGGEPSVEHVLVAGQCLAACLRDRFGFAVRNIDIAVCIIPSRNLVPPPQLAAHAPWLDIVHPVEIGLVPIGRDEFGRARPHRLNRGLGQRGSIDIPLVGQQRFDHHAGAVAIGDHVYMVFNLVEQPKRVELRHHHLTRHIAVEAAILRRGVVVHRRIKVHQVDERNADVRVALVHLIVVVIMRGGDLHCAGAEVHFHMFIGDDRDQPVNDRQATALADEMGEARVGRVHRNRPVAENRFGPRRRDGDEARAILQRIAEVPEMALHLALLNLQIADRGFQLGVPVDQPLVLVQQALAVELDEHLVNGGVEALVHREPLVRPVAACPQPPQLIGDRRAAGAFPVPDRLQKRLAAHFLPRRPLRALGKLTLDHHLRGDAGMVGANHPQRVPTFKPVIADQHVLKRVVERVAHVQAAGDVRRRDHDGERLRIRAGRMECTGRLPVRVPALLNVGRVVMFVDGHGRRLIAVTVAVRQPPAHV